MERLLQDLRFTTGVLWKDRGFAVTALLTLAHLHRRQRRHLRDREFGRCCARCPFPSPGGSSVSTTAIRRRASNAARRASRTTTIACARRMRSRNRRSIRCAGQTIGGEADPQRLTGMAVRPSFFRLLRARPLRGRIFNEDEGEIGREHVGDSQLRAVAAGLRRRAEQRLARELRINGVPHVVVGVMPQTFYFDDPDVKLWTPLAFTPAQKSDDARHSNSWTMIARLKPGATVAAGAAADRRVERAKPRPLPRAEADPDQRRLPYGRRAAAGRSRPRRPVDPVSALGRRAVRAARSAR